LYIIKEEEGHCVVLELQSSGLFDNRGNDPVSSEIEFGHQIRTVEKFDL
jgi:hypothetical protein